MIPTNKEGGRLLTEDEQEKLQKALNAIDTNVELLKSMVHMTKTRAYWEGFSFAAAICIATILIIHVLFRMGVF